VAKEGRKYGVGLMIITQRPSDVDAGVLGDVPRDVQNVV
jgi:DNA helicase HerA-like ATPase